VAWPLTDIVLVERLNASEQRELQGRMEKKQMKEFMTVCLLQSIQGYCSCCRSTPPDLLLDTFR